MRTALAFVLLAPTGARRPRSRRGGRTGVDTLPLRLLLCCCCWWLFWLAAFNRPLWAILFTKLIKLRPSPLLFFSFEGLTLGGQFLVLFPSFLDLGIEVMGKLGIAFSGRTEVDTLLSTG